MPLYEFYCADCGTFTLARKLSETSSAAQCPICGIPANKVFPLVHLRTMSATNRKVWERNERSAHRPHVCHAGCQHGAGAPKHRAQPVSERPVLQFSRKRNKRPWMLGH